MNGVPGGGEDSEEVASGRQLFKVVLAVGVRLSVAHTAYAAGEFAVEGELGMLHGVARFIDDVAGNAGGRIDLKDERIGCETGAGDYTGVETVVTLVRERKVSRSGTGEAEVSARHGGENELTLVVGSGGDGLVVSRPGVQQGDGGVGNGALVE